MCNMFGGPSSEEERLQAESSSLSRSLAANYQKEFSQQQDALARLNVQIGKISNGDTGLGFSAQEDSARRGQIESNAGAEARNITQAVQDQGAGQVFNGQTDSSGLGRASAVRQQLNEEATAHAETQKSNALYNEVAANYDQGRRNASATAAGLDSLAGRYNPGQYASESLSANQASFGQADKINQEKIAKSQAIAGLIQKGVMTAATFGMGAATGLEGTGGEGFFGKIGDAFKGGMDALGSEG